MAAQRRGRCGCADRCAATAPTRHLDTLSAHGLRFSGHDEDGAPTSPNHRATPSSWRGAVERVASGIARQA
ncbi:hypothetical protein ACQ4WX_36795 [Streptomyces lasalocidi]